MPPIRTDGHELHVDGKTIAFESEIFDTLELEDVVIVLLEWTDTDRPDAHRNVYAVDSDGSIRWQVDECPDITGGGQDVYSGLYDHDGELWITNLNGMKYRIDLRDGSVLDKKLVK